MPKHPIPWTENHCVQKTCVKIMHKTIGGFAQPNIGSKTKIFRGVASDPIKWGYRYTSHPLWPPLPTLQNRRNEVGLRPPSNPPVNYMG